MTVAKLPAYVPLSLVEKRLPTIFPTTTERYALVTRPNAAKVVFVMLYVGAIEGTATYIAPKHVYRMSDEQALKSSDAARIEYAIEVQKAGSVVPPPTWYADNSREQIRDETLRDGLIPLNAVYVRPNVPTTSSKPRYALHRDFAALFDPLLEGINLAEAIETWRSRRLSAAALARLRIVQAGATAEPTGITVTLPSGDTRRLEAGPSGPIAKGVIEEFAPRFLTKPAVLWLSQSATKAPVAEHLFAKSLGLNIDPSRTLPDIILVDLPDDDDPILVFVEVVATGGEIIPSRRDKLGAIHQGSRFGETRVAYVTAYRDRNDSAARGTIQRLAWNTFAWFAGEPDGLVSLHRGDGMSLGALLRAGRQ